MPNWVTGSLIYITPGVAFASSNVLTLETLSISSSVLFAKE